MIAPRLATYVALVSLAPALAVAQPAAAPEAPYQQQAAGQQTVAVVALAGYDRLLEDVDFLGELGGRPATADMVEGMLAFFTGGRGLEGLDKSRPIGLVLRTDGAAFTPLVCLPIPDLDPFLELAENFGLEPILGDNDIYEVETPEQTIYVRQSGDWTYAAQSPLSLVQLPDDPSAPLAKIVGEYDLGAMALVQNVPEMYRTIALEQLRQGMEEGLEQEEGESDEVFAQRREMAEAQIAELSDLIEGLDRITIGLNIDSEKKQLFLDGAMSVLEDSEMALAMKAYEKDTSSVTGFHRPEAAFSALFTAENPPELIEKQRAQIESVVKMLRAQSEKAIDEAEELPADPEVRDTLKSAVDDLIDAYESLATSGDVEFGASLGLEGGAFEMIAGLYGADPTKIESAFKKVADAAAKQDASFPGVEWGYAEHAGVKLHGMSVPLPADDPKADKARELFGDTIRLVMGVDGQRVYLGVGTNCETTLKQAIDDSAARASESVKPGEMILSLQQVLDFGEKFAEDANPQGRAVIGMMLDALEEAPAGTDRLVITVEPIQNGVRVRYLLEEGVLKAIGTTIANVAAMQAQQQQGGGGF